MHKNHVTISSCYRSQARDNIQWKRMKNCYPFLLSKNIVTLLDNLAILHPVSGDVGAPLIMKNCVMNWWFADYSTIRVIPNLRHISVHTPIVYLAHNRPRYRFSICRSDIWRNLKPQIELYRPDKPLSGLIKSFRNRGAYIGFLTFAATLGFPTVCSGLSTCCFITWSIDSGRSCGGLHLVVLAAVLVFLGLVWKTAV